MNISGRTLKVHQLVFGFIFLFAIAGLGHGEFVEKPEYWESFVDSPQSMFEWRVNPDTNKLNFRRCDLQSGATLKMVCRDPMLKVGLAPEDFIFLLNFYIERLVRVRNNNQKWIYGLTAGSLAGLGGYIGYLGALRLVADSLPPQVRSLIQRSYHLLVVGGVLGAGYYAYKLASKHSDQMAVLEEVEVAVERHPRVPPHIHFYRQDNFEEFMESFQTTILAFLNKETEPGSYFILQ